MSLVQSSDDVTILDDCYNANPSSMGAALRTFGDLASEATRKIAVLGSMLELGEESRGMHRYCGHLVAQIGIERLFVVGPYARSLAEGAAQGGVAFILTADDVGELMSQIEEAAIAGSWMLLKGSRGGRLERVLDHLVGEVSD
jgi:UDP-N-acetylmuramoyl-tripeptide--D-alanyl-D-alanine ligase